MDKELEAFLNRPCTAFQRSRRVARGGLIEVALAVKAVNEEGSAPPTLVFDDASGAIVDLDLRGSVAEVVTRLTDRASRTMQAPGVRAADTDEPQTRGRGRPRLGVVAREVTLLPRHWEWLGQQPGGASQALRRLVDQARRDTSGHGAVRAAREAAYRFMTAMAGDEPGFEEATRALFAGDRERFVEQSSAWPDDIRNHSMELAWPVDNPSSDQANQNS